MFSAIQTFQWVLVLNPCHSPFLPAILSVTVRITPLSQLLLNGRTFNDCRDYIPLPQPLLNIWTFNDCRAISPAPTPGGWTCSNCRAIPLTQPLFNGWTLSDCRGYTPAPTCPLWLKFQWLPGLHPFPNPSLTAELSMTAGATPLPQPLVNGWTLNDCRGYTHAPTSPSLLSFQWLPGLHPCPNP